jgi:hypothetical protein
MCAKYQITQLVRLIQRVNGHGHVMTMESFAGLASEQNSHFRIPVSKWTSYPVKLVGYRSSHDIASETRCVNSLAQLSTPHLPCLSELGRVAAWRRAAIKGVWLMLSGV